MTIQQELEAKTIPVKLGDTVRITDGQPKGTLVTIDDNLFMALHEYWEPSDPLPYVERTATCGDCAFMAKSRDDDDQGAFDFRAWNHEDQTGHRVAIQVEVV